MKLLNAIFCITVVIILVLLPAAAQGRDFPNYVSVKLGGFFPDDNDFENGFSGEVALGHYFSPNFAVEGGLGYVWIGDFEGTVNTVFGPVVADVDVSAAPLTVTVKAILPLNYTELYVGVGGGFYFINASVNYSTIGFPAYYDDNDVAFGGHIVAGVQLDISDLAFLGIEGKYTATDSVTLYVAGTALEVEVEGFSATGVLGFRF